MARYRLKFTNIGNSQGAVFPRAMVERLALSQGDSLTAEVNDATGTFTVSKTDPDFEEKLAIAQRVIARYHNAIVSLSKK